MIKSCFEFWSWLHIFFILPRVVHLPTVTPSSYSLEGRVALRRVSNTVGIVFAAWRGSRKIPFFDLIIFPLSCTFNEHSLGGTKFPSPEDFLREGFVRRDENIPPLKCLTRKYSSVYRAQSKTRQVLIVVGMVKLKFRTLFIFVSVSTK